jgi:hypothetical protein
MPCPVLIFEIKSVGNGILGQSLKYGQWVIENSEGVDQSGQSALFHPRPDMLCKTGTEEGHVTVYGECPSGWQNRYFCRELHHQKG